MNFWDVLLTAVIIAALALAVTSCVRKRTRGDGCCHGSCAGCRGSCEQEKNRHVD